MLSYPFCRSPKDAWPSGDDQDQPGYSQYQDSDDRGTVLCPYCGAMTMPGGECWSCGEQVPGRDEDENASEHPSEEAAPLYGPPEVLGLGPIALIYGPPEVLGLEPDDKEDNPYLCPRCGRRFAKGRFCPSCGRVLRFSPVEQEDDSRPRYPDSYASDNPYLCPRCGRRFAKGRFCPSCGKVLRFSPAEQETFTSPEDVYAPPDVIYGPPEDLF